MLLRQGSSEADVNQTERSESRPAKAGVRAREMSDDVEVKGPLLLDEQQHAMIASSECPFIIAILPRVSVGTMPCILPRHSGVLCTRTRQLVLLMQGWVRNWRERSIFLFELGISSLGIAFEG